MSSFWQGVVAGYGIAVPVGPIAVLLLDLGIRRGFRAAFAGGLGAATADLLYAGLAAIGGTAAAALLAPYQRPMRVAAAVVLGVIAARSVVRAFRPAAGVPLGRSNATAFGSVLALTLLNPVTVTYFAVLIVALGDEVAGSVSDGVLFVAGAFLASFSWQSAVAATGAGLGKRVSARARLVTGLAGGLIVAVLAVRLVV